ncbi:MAG TPA: polyphosphate polymerase domain-containing protein [Bacteroidales bacterium]|nr:polyphosphate polymerase domain-containing protein [Bacteroidales bacterium]
MKPPVIIDQSQLFANSHQQVQDSAARLQAITLGEMDQVKLLDRFDRKFVFPLFALPDILSEAARWYRILEIDGHRILAYQSTYYDTPDREMYLAHHNGKLNRYKVRRREYLTTGQVFFEIKFKSNKSRTIKKRILTTNHNPGLNKEERKFLKKITSYNPRELQPVLSNRFERITLVHRHNHERATIDMNLSYTHNASDVNLLLPVIAEIKQEKASGLSDLEKILRKHRILPCPFSKYCVGTVLTHPTIKHNRFKELLIRQNKMHYDNAIAPLYQRS